MKKVNGVRVNRNKKYVRAWMLWYLSGTIVVLEKLETLFQIDTAYARGSIKRIIRDLKKI